MRIAPVAVPERYNLPGRPSGASPTVQDAYRQANFLLDSDLPLFERAMNCQLRIASRWARERTPETAALMAFWSRAFAHMSDACVLLGHGSYASCAPLLRTACDCIAAQRSLIEEGFEEYHQWLETAIGKDRDRAATHIDLGRYRAGSALARDPRLGDVYRLLTDLSMPHFGATLLQVGPDSGEQKLSLAFPDSAFHLGWAELVSGWLLLLADAQLEVPLSSSPRPVEETVRDDAERLRKEIAQALNNPRRCRAQALEDGLRVIENFRRAVSGTPKRIVF